MDDSEVYIPVLERMAHRSERLRASDRWRAWTPRLLSILRMVAGFLIMQPGMSKLFAFPAGIPPSGGTVEPFTEMWVGGWLETVGGALLILGLYTRPAAFILSGEMAVAYWQFHAPHGFWPILNGGAAAMLYCFLYLFFSAAGGGSWGLDNLLRRRAHYRPG